MRRPRTGVDRAVSVVALLALCTQTQMIPKQLPDSLFSNRRESAERREPLTENDAYLRPIAGHEENDVTALGYHGLKPMRDRHNVCSLDLVVDSPTTRDNLQD